MCAPREAHTRRRSARAIQEWIHSLCRDRLPAVSLQREGAWGRGRRARGGERDALGAGVLRCSVYRSYLTASLSAQSVGMRAARFGSAAFVRVSPALWTKKGGVELLPRPLKTRAPPRIAIRIRFTRALHHAFLLARLCKAQESPSFGRARRGVGRLPSARPQRA